MDCLSYTKECLSPFKRQFASRGFSIVDAEPSWISSLQPYDNTFNQKTILKAGIILHDMEIGYVNISYQRWVRTRLMEDGSSTNGGNMIKSRLEIELVGYEIADGNRVQERRIAVKGSLFNRQVKGPGGKCLGPLVDDFNRSMRGKPRIRSWAAWSTKKFVEEWLPKVVHSAVEHVTES